MTTRDYASGFGRNALVLLLLLATPAAARTGDDLVGTRPPDWQGLEWLQDDPGALADLRGSVVLVRWWTDSCPYCLRSAPSLVELRERYAERGLVVIGVYHPKPRDRTISSEEIREAARERGFLFPIAVDRSWTVLRRWWLDRGGRRATSVSFLIDRSGTIRYVHPGPAFHREVVDGDRRPLEDFLELKSKLETLLSQPD